MLCEPRLGTVYISAASSCQTGMLCTCSPIATTRPAARERRTRRSLAVRASASSEPDIFDNQMGKSMLETFSPNKERLSIAWGGIKNMPVPVSVVRRPLSQREDHSAPWLPGAAIHPFVTGQPTDKSSFLSPLPRSSTTSRQRRSA